MKREWAPGDVAMAPHPVKHKAEVRGFIDVDGRFYTTDLSVKGISSSCFALDNLRPLVVIDPEDREQVARLTRIFMDDHDSGDEAGDMQAALREFANPPPPKPDEPSGLGAVVEDGNGGLWFRMSLENQTWPGEVWQEQYGDADRWSKWESLNAVRVLSEGVTP